MTQVATESFKVIFLDIDGVLCLNGHSFNPECVRQLKRIVDATGAKLCLSSTWRLHIDNIGKINGWLAEAGIERLSGKTPNLWKSDQPSERFREIKCWLQNDGRVGRRTTRFAILDDDNDAAFPHDPTSFFQTGSRTGLTAEIADGIIEYLNRI